jgi:hypothetical protein
MDLLKILIFMNTLFYPSLAGDKPVIYYANDIIAPPVPYDEHGCCISCGYSYCPELDACVRVWETICPSLMKNGH